MKKFLSGLMAAAMIASATPFAFADGVKERVAVGCGTSAAASDWAREEINEAEELGITEGLKPVWTGGITRSDFGEMAYNTLSRIKEIPFMKVSENPFTDVINAKIFALANIGILKGVGDRIYEPDGILTREEAAEILIRMAKYAEGENYTPLKEDTKYADDSEISDWARNSVYEITALDIMRGTGENFEPKKCYTSEQSAVSLLRLYNKLKGGDKAEETESFADKMNEQMPQDKNYMFSPFSIKMALAMAANGADGDTQAEILKAIDIDNLDKYNENTKNTLKNYSKSDLLKLNVSNSIWLNTDNTNQKFSKKFEDKAADVFGAEAGSVTNKTAVRKINGWVNEKTSGKISEIITEKNTDFAAMLVNAVYFKGRWRNQFDPSETKNDTFTDRNGKKSEIPFMNKTLWAKSGIKDGVRVVELPYQNYDYKSDDGQAEKLGFDISMYLMQSDEKFNAETVLKSAKLNSEYIALSMPKFKVEYSTGLNEMLKKLGIDKAFDERAEFENMFDSGNAAITDTIHKTYINVDEEGTEAAAVMAISVGTTALPPEPVSVKFDKPFTFVIRDNTSGDILFMGEYAFAE